MSLNGDSLDDAAARRARFMDDHMIARDMRLRVEAGVMCTRCEGLGTEGDGNTACIECGNSGVVPLPDGTYGTHEMTL